MDQQSKTVKTKEWIKMTHNLFYCCGTMLKKEDTCVKRYPMKATEKKTETEKIYN